MKWKAYVELPLVRRRDKKGKDEENDLNLLEKTRFGHPTLRRRGHKRNSGQMQKLNKCEKRMKEMEVMASFEGQLN